MRTTESRSRRCADIKWSAAVSNAVTCSLLRRLTGEATFNFCNRARESFSLLPSGIVPILSLSHSLFLFLFLSVYSRGFGSFDPLLCLTDKPQPLFALFLLASPRATLSTVAVFVVSFSAEAGGNSRVRSCASIAVDNRHEQSTESEAPIRN